MELASQKGELTQQKMQALTGIENEVWSVDSEARIAVRSSHQGNGVFGLTAFNG